MSVASLFTLSAKREAQRQFSLPDQAINPQIPQVYKDAIETLKNLNSYVYQRDVNFNKAYYAINTSYNDKIDQKLNTEIAVYYFIQSLNHLNPRQKEHSFRIILKKCIRSNNLIAFDRFIQIIRNNDDLNLDNILVLRDHESIKENLLYLAAKKGSTDILNYLYELDNNLINLKITTSSHVIDEDIGLAYDELRQLPILKVAIEKSLLNNYCPYNIQNINYLLNLHPNIIYKGAIHDAISCRNPKTLRALLNKNPLLINELDDTNLSPIDLLDFDAALLGRVDQIEMLEIFYEYKEHFTDLEKKALIDKTYREIVRKRDADDSDFSDEEIKEIKPKNKKRS